MRAEDQDTKMEQLVAGLERRGARFVLCRGGKLSVGVFVDDLPGGEYARFSAAIEAEGLKEALPDFIRRTRGAA